MDPYGNGNEYGNYNEYTYDYGYDNAYSEAGSAENTYYNSTATGFSEQQLSPFESQVRDVFYQLDPEHFGDQIALGDLEQACRLLELQVEDKQLSDAMTTLDTSNQMVVFRSDFVNWVFMLQNAPSKTPSGREAQEVPVAEFAWQEIIDETVVPDPLLTNAIMGPSVYYYNVLTGETKWELPSFIMNLTAFWTSHHEFVWPSVASETTDVTDTVNTNDTVKKRFHEQEEMELMQKIRRMFVKFDEDQSESLDVHEFQDLCTAIGHRFALREELNALVDEIDPFSKRLEGVVPSISWNAFNYFVVTNVPFQRRILMANPPNSMRKSVWEQFDDLSLNTREYINTSTQFTRWNHPEMERNIGELINKTFDKDITKKMDLVMKVRLLYQQYLELFPNWGSEWQMEHFHCVLQAIGHVSSSKKQLVMAMEALNHMFRPAQDDARDPQGEQKPRVVDVKHLTVSEDVVLAWFLSSVRKVESGGWEEVHDDQGMRYYYHDDTGESQWDPPQVETTMNNLMNRFEGSINERIERLFRSFDEDASGGLSPRELVKVCHALGYSMTNEQAQELFQVLDTSGDGVVSPDEFKVWWKAKLSIEEEETEEDRARRALAQKKATFVNFLESTSNLVRIPNTSRSDSGSSTENDLVCFDSLLLPRLVALYGYGLRGTWLIEALNDLVKDQSQLVQLEDFLKWFEQYEILEQARRMAAAAAAEAAAKMKQEQAEHDGKSKKKKKNKGAAGHARKVTNIDRENELEKQHKERIAKLFRQFDTDNSGTLDKLEIRDLTKSLGHEMELQQIAQMMSIMDRNADGDVNCQEFTTFWLNFERKESLLRKHGADSLTSAEAKSITKRFAERLAQEEEAKRLDQIEQAKLKAEARKKRQFKRTSAASLAVGWETKRTKLKELKGANFKETLHNLQSLTKESMDEDLSISDEEAEFQKQQELEFRSLKKRKYGANLDVTAIPPPIVELMHDMINYIQQMNFPWLPADACVIIQKEMRRCLAKKRALRIIVDRFKRCTDWSTQHFYYVDLYTGHVLMDRPVYPSEINSVDATEQVRAQTDKTARVAFTRKRNQTLLKNNFYEKHGFDAKLCGKWLASKTRDPKPLTAARKLDPRKQKTSEKQLGAKLVARVLATFYYYDVIRQVKRRLLGGRNLFRMTTGVWQDFPEITGGIWYALRNNEFVLAQLIATRYHHQLQECSADASRSLPLHFAVRQHQCSFGIIESLVANYPHAVVVADSFGLTPFHLAIREKRAFDIVKFLANKSICRRKTKSGDTPLHIAILHRANVEVVQFLLDLDEFGTPMVHHSARRERLPAKMIRNNRGFTPFHLCILQFDGTPYCKQVVMAFLKHEDDGHTKCSQSWTTHGDLPVHVALDNKHFQRPLRISVISTSTTSDLTTFPAKAPTPANRAVTFGSPSSSPPPPPPPTALQFEFATWLLTMLIKNHPESLLQQKQSTHILPMHQAIKNGFHTSLVLTLIHETMAVCQQQLAEQPTSLDLLELRNSRSSMDLLEADLSFSFSSKSSSMRSLSETLPTTVCQQLRTRNGMTLLHYALLHRAVPKVVLEICNLMPEALQTRCHQGNLPLHIAAWQYDDVSVLETLIAKYPQAVQQRNNKKQLPLHLAVEKSLTSNVRVLLHSVPWTLLEKDDHELEALVLACKARFPKTPILVNLLDPPALAPKRPKYVSNQQLTPFYALATQRIACRVHSKQILDQIEPLDQVTSDEMVNLAKKKLRRKHFAPNANWTFKAILQAMERNPSDESVMQRALFAINEKLETLQREQERIHRHKALQPFAKKQFKAMDTSKDKDQALKSSWIVETITLDADLGLVRQVHFVLYEFSHHERIQLLGKSCLAKLLPNAYAKVRYKSKIDPYFNM